MNHSKKYKHIQLKFLFFNVLNRKSTWTTLEIEAAAVALSGSELHWSLNSTDACTHSIFVPPLRTCVIPAAAVLLSRSGVSECRCRRSHRVTQEGGHRARLNLQTKRCSSLTTQWDLPVQSLPAAICADTQLTGITLWPQKHKGAPASNFSHLKPLC